MPAGHGSTRSWKNGVVTGRVFMARWKASNSFIDTIRSTGTVRLVAVFIASLAAPNACAVRAPRHVRLTAASVPSCSGVGVGVKV